ncbi:UTP--glucose-1-phosphate uridylyltransferase [Paenibacillus sp. GSMTC-2017]|uniref:UTP--glucose-1-phosphate uridylyltransferase n=1 Tax=Paenibacillus sp. GSMTC-2017 TaxID=2794350 RepID=UPI001E5305C2|nr:UTP--glucose-1-phosphate uridylyltransferase [Paenibacillus sp. GSMTC-2017]
MIHRAIIPAAGYGIRNLPVTKSIPKEMFPIAGRPTIEYIVEEAILAGIEEILIVLSRNKNEIMNYFDRSIELECILSARGKDYLIPKITPPKVRIHYIRQHEALGLGHAVLLGQSFAGNEPFAVLLPDQVSLQRTSMLIPLIKTFDNFSTNVIGLQHVKTELLKNYGVVSAKRIKQRVFDIESIVEKPEINPPSNLALMGRYILKSEIFELLKETRPGQGGEIQLTDALSKICSTSGMIGYAYKERWYDTSIDLDYLKIQQQAIHMNL